MILFIGDKPSKTSNKNIPFKGAKCEKRLISWIKYLIEENETYVIINRIDKNAMTHVYLAQIYKVPIIVLGNNAEKFIRSIKPLMEYFKLPHPSGLNRQINDKQYVETKLRFAKIHIKRIKST